MELINKIYFIYIIYLIINFNYLIYYYIYINILYN